MKRKTEDVVFGLMKMMSSRDVHGSNLSIQQWRKAHMHGTCPGVPSLRVGQPPASVGHFHPLSCLLAEVELPELKLS
ncbi:hypothetical protein V6N12_000080 [Hibiscus sabdariffa]|uniref:Uncharacterized protein n=1 Tax=Hibiscus sabdariffa TaxID=183260 RepID=A0ABR2BHI7_9ROSI